ncbi:MAG: hypothetical protein IJU19_08765 [Bacteroidales bacterium]|nr:hypothetical protein [Bacteroidales bacterium]
MKKIIALAFMFPLALGAQNAIEDTLLHSSKQVSANKADCKRQLKDCNKEKQNLLDSINQLNNSINRLNDSISEAVLKKEQLDSMLTETKSLYRTTDSLLRHADTILFRMASNFIYIPYESYSIDKVAIPSYKAISDTTYKKRNIARLTLLEHYRSHTEELIRFLSSINPQNTRRTITGITPHIDELHQLQCYTEYQQYDDWKHTDLGRRMLKIENILDRLKKERRDAQRNECFDQLKQMAAELKRCLNT